MQRFRTLVGSLIGALSVTIGAANAESPAVWAQSSDTDAIEWSGAKSSVHGIIHSNGGITISGSKNEWLGGAEYVTEFVNHKTTGSNANVVNPAAIQVSPRPLPRSYTINDFMPGSAAAIAAGTSFVDLSTVCEANGISGASLSYINEAIPDQLIWAPCDVLFSAMNSSGNVTVVSPGKIHFKAHNNSHLSAFSEGVLVLSGSTSLKAIHLNGNKSMLHGDLIAFNGEIHVAGSNQTLSCGVFGDRIKVSGSSFVVTGEECAVPTNNAPMAVDDFAVTTVDAAIAIDVLANDSDSDGTLDTTSVAILTPPANGNVTFSSSTGVAIYTPDVGFVGSDSFAYTVSDDRGAVSQPATVSIAVEVINSPPLAVDDLASTSEDTEITIIVLSNDSDTDGVLDVSTVTIVNAPLNGTAVAVLATGIVEYVPDADFFGADSFVYTVSDGDGAASNEATVQVTVLSVNDAPVVQSDSASGLEDNLLFIDVLANDFDVDSRVTIRGVSIISSPNHGSLSIDSEFGLRYVPDPDYFGADSFTYRLFDSFELGSVDTATVSIFIGAVNDLPVAPDATVDVAEDGALAILLQATDIESDPLTYAIISGPSSGTLTGIAPNLTYTPTPNFAGADSLSYTASDSTADSAPGTITINVLPINDVPVMVDQDFDGVEDLMLDLTIVVIDVDGDTLNYSLVSPPANGTLTGPGPSYQYAPDADFAGGDSFILAVDDGAGGVDTAVVTLTVAAVNDASIAAAQSLSTGEDTPLSVVPSGTDVDGDSLTFVIDSGPSNGTLSGMSPNLTYTPNVDFNGNDSITFHANDGTVDSAPAIIDITVTSGNDAPVAADQNLATNEDTGIDIVLGGSDVDGDSLTFAVAMPPSNGTLAGTDANVRYVPSADFDGTDSFTFVANDGLIDSAPGVVSVTVAPVNDAPTASDLAVSTDEDVAVSVDLIGGDMDGDALVYTVQLAPANGSLSGTPPSLAYTPEPNFNGSDTLTFTTSDGQLVSNAATVLITVNAVNDAPQVDAQSLVTDEDTSVSIMLTGSDAEGALLTFTVLNAPASGSLSGIAPDLLYTPANDFNGADGFTFQATDGTDQSLAAMVSITVAPINDAPIADNQGVDAIAGTAVAVTLSGQDIEGDALTYRVVTQPANGTLSGTTPTLSYTADLGFAGIDSFSYVISDGSLDSSPGVVTLVVVDNNNAPTVTSIPLTTASTGVQYSYQVVAADADGDPISYALSTAPTDMTISSTGLANWMPPASGSFDIVIDVRDDRGGLTQQAYVLSVTDNQGPEFVQLPLLNAPLGERYRSVGLAVDPEGDSVTVELTSGPPGAALTDLGAGRFEIVWTSAGAIGDATPFSVVAIDSNGASNTLNYSVVTTGNTINRSHLGDDFWLVFGTNFLNYGFGLGAMPTSHPGRQLQLIIGAPTGANGTIDIAGLSFSQIFAIAPGETATIDIPISAMGPQFGSSVSRGPGNNSVHVVTDQPVTVAGVNWAFATTDAFLVLPTSTLGTRYVVTGYEDILFDIDPHPETIWEAVAIEDDTTLTITRIGGVPNYAGGQSPGSSTVTLNRGQNWSTHISYAHAVELVADKPIAAFSGSSCANVPNNVSTCDHLWEQFLPDTSLASRYLTAPIATRSASLYRVIANEDDTKVFVNDQYVALLDRGEKYERMLSGALEIEASRPVVAVQYTPGNQFDTDIRMNNLADPFMLNLAPTDAFLSDYTFVVPSGQGVLRDQPNNIIRPPIENHYISVVIPASAAGSLVFDDVPVDTRAFEAVGSSDFIAGTVLTVPGTHRIAANEQFGLHIYGFGQEESYGYYGGLIFPDGTASLDVIVEDPVSPLIVGSQEACLNIETRDLGGALVPRARFQIDISGTIPNAYTGFSNAAGVAQYCYTQVQPGIDNITVSVIGDSQTVVVEWLADVDPNTNGAPSIISFPDLALYDPTFVYPMQIADPDGDAVSVTVSNGPAGMIYSDITGEVSWTPAIPPNRAPTVHPVELIVTDPSGASSAQLFELTVYYPPLITQFPTIRFVDAFGGRRETAIRHIGGDNNLIQGRKTAGSASASITRFDFFNQWTTIITPISFDRLEGLRKPNLMCRAPGASIGNFATDRILFDNTLHITSSAAGPVVDTNADGLIDNADDIYSLHVERDDVVRLYNLTTQTTAWANTRNGATGHIPAMVNLDADPELEMLVPMRELVAFDTDGTMLWESPNVLDSFSRARQMSVVASDLDGDGTTEILFGRQVYDSSGQFLWSFDMGTASRPDFILPVPADLDGDGDMEVLLRNQVRDSDGTLLWTIDADTNSTQPDAYHAVADIVGDSRLEIISSVATSAGARMYAWDADGNLLWEVVVDTRTNIAIPVIADFDGDGELDIYQPQARTMISADGRIKSEDDFGVGNVFEEMKVLDLNGDGVYETLDDRQDFEYILSDYRWANTGSGHFFAAGDKTPFKFVDSDHDGNVELMITSFFGLSLHENRDGSWQMPQRDYRQNLYFDANGFGVDVYAPQDPTGLQADAWVGNLFINGTVSGGLSFAADVVNRGTGNIVEDVTVSFYRGFPESGTLLGQVVIPEGLPAGDNRTISIPVARADLDGILSARLTFAGPVDQCETQNDEVAGTFTEFELFDGPSEYRTARFSFIYRILQEERDVRFQSTPQSSVTLGQTYVYDVDALAPNFGDDVRYSASGSSLGVEIDQITGVVTWTPTFDQVGTRAFTVFASTLADSDDQLVTVDVIARANDAPLITTAPNTMLLLLGSSFAYDVDATDADGDMLLYELSVAPQGMSIDSTTGLVNWTPDLSQIGLFPVTVSVDDAFGGVATQNFSLQVGSTSNTGPTITSAPPVLAKATFRYQYQLVVDDPDGDFIAYSVQSGPTGMTIDGNGLLSWTPDVARVEDIAVRASDGQAFVDQGWTLTVSDADIPLQATISANPSTADLGTTVDLTVGYSGAAGNVSVSVTVDGNPAVVSATGIATVPADTVGLHTATAIVSDMFASDSASVTYTVIDPNSTSVPPIVSLTTPDFEEEVTAPRDATGSITDPDGDLLSWFLALQARGAPATEFTTIASGTTEIPNGVIGQIDPTMLINGLYTVILQATDAAGNVSQDARVIRVTGDLKIGNFSVTFEDFSAPVAGLPVTVLRTYDTRRRNENLDFGFGWSVDYQNVRLQESRDIGFSWSLIEEDLGFFSQFCVRPNGDPTVTVRMPDGEVESFVARAEPECTQLVPTVDVNIVFVPTDGTDSTLEQTDFGTVRIINNNIVDLGAPDVPIDPDAYRLTTPEGLIFSLDQSFGIRQVEEPNGSTLTFSDSGIVHSQGFALTFTRDTQGRITAITAPDGTAMSYGYDANGDLTRFTDQVLQNTDYTYQFGTEHYLEDILDPRGIRVSRNEYDAAGRLIAIIDADGNRIEYDHNITGRIETIRDRRGNATVYLYDDEGNVLIETNALGESITRTYDTDRNELSMSNDLGHTTSWSYDERGNQLTETDALMQTTSSSYDSRNLLLSVVDAAGNAVMSNVYDSRNTNLLTLTDALLNTTTFFWDAGIGSGCSTGASLGTEDALLNRTTIQPQCIGPFAELPAYQEDARGVRTSFGYDAVGRQISETTTRTDASGVVQSLTTTLVYDDKGRVTQVTDAAGNITRTGYNAIDKASASVDANGNRTEFDYDARGNRILTRFADLTRETTGYDAEGNVISQTDRQNRTTRMTYDAANRLIETVFPDTTPGNDLDNPRTHNEYDTAGRLTATMDELGNRTVFEYDTAGRRTLIRDALLQETRFEYDVRGLRTAMIDASNRRTAFIYDVAGRLTETIFPDDTPADQTDNLRSSTGYDALGRKTADTDPAGLTTGFEYDEIGNLTAVVDALLQRTVYGYDEQSNKITQTDAALRTTNWAYDNVGRVSSRTLPESQSETFSYDNNGNRDGHTDFNGAIHSFGYDNLNRQTTAIYADGTIVTTTYTDTGQVESVTDDRGATAFSYDERERLTNISYPNGKSIGYGYDNTGNKTSLTTANQSLTYTFDVLNRLATVTDEAGTTAYGYDAVGNRASIDNANGTSTGYVYDELNRLTELSQFDVLNTMMDQHSYVLAPNGNRTQHAELNGRTVDYTYDDLYRLTEEIATDATLGNRTNLWTYDAVGNRLTQTATSGVGTTTTTYAYDNNDRLTTETASGSNPASTVYSYDNNGNTLTKTAGTETTTYAYDSRNRLQDLNAGQVTYQYDALGIRQSETVASLTTHYLTDPNRDFAQVIEESFDLNAFAETKYTYGDDLISQHRRVDAVTTNSSTYHYDGIGSTRLLTDETGNVTDTYAFTAFGEAEGSTGFTVNDYLYTGEQFDPNLGFYYLRARYYNPGVGRFATMDTFAGKMIDPLSLHKYMYVHADPIGNLDPSGNLLLPALGFGLLRTSIGRAVLINAAKPLLKRVAKVVALAVVAHISMRIRKRKEDQELPPMFLVGNNHPEIRDHVEEAQMQRGISQFVHRRSSPHSRSWLSTSLTKNICGAGLSGGGTGKDCDEFPMAIHIEGGRQNFLTGRVSIKPASLNQNRSIGGLVGSFHRSCNIPQDSIRFEDAYVMTTTSASTHFICGTSK